MEDKFNLYDKIVNSILMNVYSERQRAGKIVLWDFYPKDDVEMLYYNISAIVSDIEHDYIYLDLGLIDYLKFKWKKRKGRKNLRRLTNRIKNKLPQDSKTSVYILMDYVKSYYNVDMNTLRNINKEYYGERNEDNCN